MKHQSHQIRRISRWVFLTFLSAYAIITRGHFQSTDEIAVYEQARALWERGDLDVSPMINTRIGRGGRSYAVYGVGQSLAAVPLYVVGKLIGTAIATSPQWTLTFAGPTIANGSSRWGGDVEIFAVSLFGAIAAALVCTVFFVFSTQFGATPHSALVGVALFGTTSYIVGFASNFFQHALETLTVLTGFYLLFKDARVPSVLYRALAGLLVGYTVVVRAQSLVLVPALSGYFVWNLCRRQRLHTNSKYVRIGEVLLESLPFFGLVFLGMCAQLLINNFKFGSPSFSGGYTVAASFDSSLLTSLYGFLFSPGQSIFVFTPLLIVVPLYATEFKRVYPVEAACILGMAISYLLFYGKYVTWHAQWSFGPRFLLVIVPLLLLPFAGWWVKASASWRAVALALGALGLLVQTLHVAVNFSYVYHFENYTTYRPEFGFLFIPQDSQLASHYRALMAGDHRVDMWLVTVYRQFGMGRLLVVSVPLVALLGFSLWGLRRAVRGVVPRFKTTHDAVLSS